jgi:hypothetical protein
MSQPPPPRAVSSGTLLRGFPKRHTDMMEAFQISYVGAVAASAGCNIGTMRIDDGIDLMLHHKADGHQGDGVARLEVQLKATSDYAARQSDYVAINMSKERYDYYRTVVPTLHKIIVVLSMPKDQAKWVSAQHQALMMRHCAYWVNGADLPESKAQRPVVKAPRDQIFDDVALCLMMERIGQGGRP